MSESHDMRLNVDASGAERGFGAFTAALTQAARASSTFQNQTKAVFNGLGDLDQLDQAAKSVAKLSKAIGGFSSSGTGGLGRAVSDISSATKQLQALDITTVQRNLGALRREFGRVGTMKVNTTSILAASRSIQQALNNLNGLNTTGVTNAMNAFRRAASALSNVKVDTSSINNAVNALQSAMHRLSTVPIGNLSALFGQFQGLRVSTAFINSVARLSVALQNFQGPSPAAMASLRQFINLGNTANIAQWQALATVAQRMSSLRMNIPNANAGGISGLSSAFSALLPKVTSAHGVFRGFENALNTSYQAASMLRVAIGDLTMGKFVEGVFESGKAFNSMKFALDAVSVSAQETADQVAYVGKLTQELPIDRATMQKSYGKFAVAARLSGNEPSEIQSTYKNFAETFSVLHLDTHQQENAFLALEQMYSKGKIQAEELRRQLGQYLPGAFEHLAVAMGVSTKKLGEMMQAGEVGTENVAKLGEHLHRMFGSQVPAAMDTSFAQLTLLKNRFEEFKLAVFEGGFDKGLADLGRGLRGALEAQGITDLGKSAGAAFKDLFGVIAGVGEAAIRNWKEVSTVLGAIAGMTAFAGFLAMMRMALGPVMMLGSAIGGITGTIAGLAGASATTLGVLGLIGPAFTVIAVAAAGLGAAYLLTKDKTLEFEGVQVKTKDAVKATWDMIAQGPANDSPLGAFIQNIKDAITWVERLRAAMPGFMGGGQPINPNEIAGLPDIDEEAEKKKSPFDKRLDKLAYSANPVDWYRAFSDSDEDIGLSYTQKMQRDAKREAQSRVGMEAEDRRFDFLRKRKEDDNKIPDEDNRREAAKFGYISKAYEDPSHPQYSRNDQLYGKMRLDKWQGDDKWDEAAEGIKKTLDPIRVAQEEYKKALELLDQMRKIPKDSKYAISEEDYDRMKARLDETFKPRQDPFQAALDTIREETAAMKEQEGKHGVELELLQMKKKMLKEVLTLEQWRTRELEMRNALEEKANADPDKFFKDHKVTRDQFKKDSPIDKAREDYNNLKKAYEDAANLPEGNPNKLSAEESARRLRELDLTTKDARDPLGHTIETMEKEIALQKLGKDAREIELEVLQKKNELIKKGVDFETEEGKVLEAKLRTTIATHHEAQKGGETGFERWVHGAQSLKDALADVEKNGIDKLADAMTELVTTGTTDWKKLGDSILTEINRALIKDFIKDLLGLTNNAGGFSLARFFGGGSLFGGGSGGGSGSSSGGSGGGLLGGLGSLFGGGGSSSGGSSGGGGLFGGPIIDIGAKLRAAFGIGGSSASTSGAGSIASGASSAASAAASSVAAAVTKATKSASTAVGPNGPFAVDADRFKDLSNVTADSVMNQPAAAMASKWGVSNATLNKLFAVESGFNPTANAATSSAAGLGQFTKGTWAEYVLKNRQDIVPDNVKALTSQAQQIAALKNNDAIQALRADPAMMSDATGWLTNRNTGLLTRAGLPVTDANLYAAHFGGYKGIEALKANPEARLDSLLGADQMYANRNITMDGKKFGDFTAGDFKAWTEKKMDTDAARVFKERGIDPNQPPPGLGATPANDNVPFDVETTGSISGMGKNSTASLGWLGQNPSAMANAGGMMQMPGGLGLNMPQGLQAMQMPGGLGGAGNNWFQQAFQSKMEPAIQQVSNTWEQSTSAFMQSQGGAVFGGANGVAQMGQQVSGMLTSQMQPAAQAVGAVMQQSAQQQMGQTGFWQSLFGGAGGGGAGGGGLFSGLSNLFGGFSEGGYATAPMHEVSAPLSAFANAPHFAEGGVTGGGIPAVLHNNEAVIPLSRGRAVPVELTGANGNDRNSNQSSVVNQFRLNITTPDPHAFKASERQLQTDLVRMLQLANAANN